MSKRRCMALETLLTFCPPAPWARMALISISLAGIATLVAIRSMVAISPDRRSSRRVPAAEFALVARRQTLDLVLGFGRGRSIGKFDGREQAPRRVGTGITRALAALVRGVTRINVDGDPGVDAPVPALDKVDKPGHTRLLNRGSSIRVFEISLQQLGLRGGEARDRHARPGAGHVVDRDAMAKVDRSGITAMLAADAYLEIGPGLAAALDCHFHQLPHALDVQHFERVVLQDAGLEGGRQKLG